MLESQTTLSIISHAQVPEKPQPLRNPLHLPQTSTHLKRDACASGHCIPVPGARMRGRRREVSAAVTTGRQNRLVRPKAVDRPVLHVESDDAAAGAIFVHDQVERKELDEELRVVAQRLAIQGVQQGVPRAVGGRRTPER